MFTATETSSHPKPLAGRRPGCPAPPGALVLANGMRLRFRPVGSSDHGALAGLFDRLSFESRYRRFFGPKPGLTSRELTFLTDIDHVEHEAIAAVDEGDGSIVGVARYVSVPGRSGVAEVAIEVADELQNMGVGTELAVRTVERARANGMTRLIAMTLSDSRPARALLRGLGFRVLARHGREIEFEFELEADAVAAARLAA